MEHWGVKRPKLAMFLMKRLLLPYECEEKLGDFDEVFLREFREKGPWRARCWYWRQAFLSFPAFLLNLLYWSIVMFKNYLKIALRSIQKQKLNSFLNIIGLSVGMACSLLIILHVKHEFSYDRHFPKANRIYRLIDADSPTARGWACTSPDVGLLIREEIPEIEQVTRFFYMQNLVVSYISEKGEVKRFDEDGGFFSDPETISLLDLNFLQGDPERALKDVDTVIITSSLAKKYFGLEDPIGKTLLSDWPKPWKVTGVIEDLPSNTHFRFDFLVSMSTMYKYVNKGAMTSRGWNAFYTYVVIDPHHTREKVDAKLPDFIARFNRDGGVSEEQSSSSQLYLQPITDIHLYSHMEKEFGPNSNIAYVYIFSAIAFFILLIAGVNFVNITTAYAFKRMKEVGIRKVVGAHKRQLVKQFLGESMLMAIVSGILAVFLFRAALPFYNQLSGKSMHFSQIFVPQNFAVLLAVVLFLGALAGLYPAFFLSGFKPVDSIRGIKDPKSFAARIRKGLVVFQFVISVFMIFSTVTIYKQMKYFREKDLGFDKDQIVAIKLYGDLRRSFIKNGQTIKAELMRHPAVSRVGAVSKLPGERCGYEVFRPEGTPDDQNLPNLRYVRVDEDYIETLGLTLKEGRSFAQMSPGKNAFIINEAVVRTLNLKDPVGKKAWHADEGGVEILGVLKDYNYASLHNTIDPLVLDYNPSAANYMLVKIQGGNIPEAMEFLKAKLDKIAPGHPLIFTFVDEFLNMLYRSEEVVSNIFKSFSMLAILIACMGLFGLSVYSAELRVKEIGVRKVLGASIPNIVLLLSKEFTKWVFMACVIALPLAYFAMNEWLRNFAYRTNISIEIFVLSVSMAALIAILTVSYQSVKAAVANPVDSLRYE
jgi:putative ABC transport system permease protein